MVSTIHYSYNIQDVIKDYYTHKETSKDDLCSKEKELMETNFEMTQIWKLLDKKFKVVIITVFKNIKESTVISNEHIRYLNREKKLLKKNLMENLLNKFSEVINSQMDLTMNWR